MVLLFPACRELLVQSGHLILVLCDKVVDLNLDTVASLFEEHTCLPLGQSLNLLRYSLDLRITTTKGIRLMNDLPHLLLLLDESVTDLLEVKHL